MRKKLNVLSEKETTYNGQKVKVKQLKPKEKKRDFYVARDSVTTCPNCISAMRLNSAGKWECTGDKLKLWESDFVRYRKMSKEERLKYITDISSSSRFLELYDRWAYALESEGEEAFDCGYSNILFPLHGSVQVKIPDPLFTKIIEQKLGRPLTEEEIYGEHELYFYQGRVLTEWRNNAKLIRIPFVILPSEDTVYEPIKSTEPEKK